MLDDGTVDGLRTLLVSRSALSEHADLSAVTAGCSTVGYGGCSQVTECAGRILSWKVMRSDVPGRRIGRVGADDDGNLCVWFADLF